MAGESALARRLALVLVFAAVLAGCGGSSVAAAVPRVALPSVRVPAFKHVVVVVFENPTVRPGSRFARVTNHYGLLRTVEDARGLPRRGFSRKGTPVDGIWKK